MNIHLSSVFVFKVIAVISPQKFGNKWTVTHVVGNCLALRKTEREPVVFVTAVPTVIPLGNAKQ